VVTTKIREALGFHLNQDTIYPYWAIHGIPQSPRQTP
jgi:hypothetical protein